MLLMLSALARHIAIDLVRDEQLRVHIGRTLSGGLDVALERLLLS